jgi:hypothetical protein
VMGPEVYPATFHAADVASAAAQRRHFALVFANLSAAFSASLALSVSGVVPAAWAEWVWRLGTVLLVTAVIALWVARARRDEQSWFDCRAIAESTRSSAWRFMMRASPFRDEGPEDARLAFVEQIKQIREARSHVAQLLNEHFDVSRPELTAGMEKVRNQTLIERRAFFLNERLVDQAAWYQQRSRQNQAVRERYFLLVLALQLGATALAVAHWTPLGVNVVGVVVALTASLTAWSQSRRHDDLAISYALAAQELATIRGRVEAAPDDAAFADTVAEGEEAISREHTMWMARRNRR